METKTARKPVQIEPTVIRLNRVSGDIKSVTLVTFSDQGLRNFDSPRKERIVLDFGSSDLVSSGIA